MKNTVKKIGMMVAIMIISLMFAMSGSAHEPTGQCGDNVYWSTTKLLGSL